VPPPEQIEKPKPRDEANNTATELALAPGFLCHSIGSMEGGMEAAITTYDLAEESRVLTACGFNLFRLAKKSSSGQD